ncbi:hypothetical protein Dimus_001983 [Dionaea muscipula]
MKEKQVDEEVILAGDEDGVGVGQDSQIGLDLTELAMVKGLGIEGCPSSAVAQASIRGRIDCGKKMGQKVNGAELGTGTVMDKEPEWQLAVGSRVIHKVLARPSEVLSQSHRFAVLDVESEVSIEDHQ